MLPPARGSQVYSPARRPKRPTGPKNRTADPSRSRSSTFPLAVQTGGWRRNGPCTIRTTSTASLGPYRAEPRAPLPRPRLSLLARHLIHNGEASMTIRKLAIADAVFERSPGQDGEVFAGNIIDQRQGGPITIGYGRYGAGQTLRETIVVDDVMIVLEGRLTVSTD